MAAQKTNFPSLLAQYYKALLGNLAESVRLLADIQKKHKKEYGFLQEMQANPESIFTAMEDLETKDKALLLDLIAKVGKIDRKFKELHKLDVKEKVKLAKEIDDFKAWVEKEIER